MRYLLNSAVVTTPGRYTYTLLTTDEARAWADEGDFVSTIGYPETAAVASNLLGKPVKIDRRVIKMQVGDQALVVRLAFAPGSKRINPMDKGRLGQEVIAGNIELGLLTRDE